MMLSRWAGVGLVALTGAIWFVDSPRTVGLKSAIVHMLPVSGARADAKIRALCEKAFAADASSVTSCNDRYRDHAFLACLSYRNRVKSHPEEWRKVSGSLYSYIGSRDIGVVAFDYGACTIVASGNKLAA